jgi:hypothetical protein
MGPIDYNAAIGKAPHWNPLAWKGYTLGGTGTRSLEPRLWNEAKGFIRERMEFIHPTGVVTGGCIGWDHMMGEYCALRWPDLEHRVVVPADRSRVEAWWLKPGMDHVIVEEMPPGTTYRDRNARLVLLADVFAAGPDYPEGHPASRRSGTWQTIRMALETGLQVDLVTKQWLLEQDQIRRPSQTADLRK